jgi:glycerophosphoryl diester phosphodiesterase
MVPKPARTPAEVLRIAHRGRSGVADLDRPEAAGYQPAQLRRVAELGMHLVELDLRGTRDGELVVHHDPVLAVSGRRVAISRHTLAELDRIAGSSARLPTAAEVFAGAGQAGLGIYADIKGLPVVAGPRLVELAGSEPVAGRIILASADSRIVARCAGLAPQVPRAVLFRSRFADPVRLARRARADFVHPCWDAHARPDRWLTRQWLARVRGIGVGVVCWHEERPEVIAELLALGVDGICTDEPALLTRLATRRPAARRDDG